MLLRAVQALFALSALANAVVLPQATTNTTSTTWTTSSAASSTATLLCPAANGTTYTALNSDVFTIACAIDHAGGDLSNVQSPTFGSCLNTCSTTSGCVAVSYVPGSGYCYMKSTVNAASSASYVWAAVLKTPTANSSSSPVSSTSSPTSSSPTVNNACATVSSLVATQTAATPTVPAPVAWACMQSVPLNVTSALILVKDIIPYVNWQTTTSYLKNPPPGYLQAAVDIYGELATIQAKLSNGSYANEYQFEFELYRVFQTAHDGHFRYSPTLVAGIFNFARPQPIVSVSVDGVSLPQLYLYADIVAQSAGASFTPSVINLIDGEDAVTYVKNLSSFGSLQDPDALYNNVGYSLAQVSLGTTGTGAGSFTGGGRGAYFYAGQNTTLTFVNGTSFTFDNFAYVYESFVNVTTGQEVYNTYLDPGSATTAASEGEAESGFGSASPVVRAVAAAAGTPAPGYPTPVIRQANNQIGGYYLNVTGYEDAAVLSVPSFVSYFSEEASFQSVGDSFLAAAYAAGKTKLIIDLSANAGGTVLQGYSLFKSLFPSMDPYGGTRFRAHEAFNLIGFETSAFAGPVYPWNIYAANDSILNDFAETPFDYRADMTQNGTDFTSWSQKFGPHEFYGDEFTSIIRWNLSDPFSLPGSGIVVDGYGTRSNVTQVQRWASKDIIVMYDGYCASTCTIFSELMTSQGNVQTVAMGGRPQVGSMQAVGGVKGVNGLSCDSSPKPQ